MRCDARSGIVAAAYRVGLREEDTRKARMNNGMNTNNK